MQIDPSRWLVSLAGFGYDWMITRSWKRILLAMFPVFLPGTVVGLVWLGRQMDREALASHYRELGDQEIAGWEEDWGATDNSARQQESLPAAGEGGGSEEVAQADSKKKIDGQPVVSPFAEMLFRRAQVLSPSDHSQFVVGATYAQRGAIAKAKATLSKIAPDDRAGYAPAHAFLAYTYLKEFQREPNRELMPLLKHHAWEATKAPKAPEAVLQAGSDLFWISGERPRSLDMLAQAAKINPENNVMLAKRARVMGNARVAEQAQLDAESYLLAQLGERPSDEPKRLKLARLYLDADKFDQAETILREGEKLENSPGIARGLSELYRRRFQKSLKVKDGSFLADLTMLNQAMRLDPTNPMVAEEVAKLARIGGPEASREMIDQLKMFLAEGKATAATHAWLAEAYVVRGEHEKALPHLEQVITRLPKSAKYLNNTAYILAELYPDRLEEALALSKRAVAASTRSDGQAVADYYDTLGFVCLKLDRNIEAIAAFESAVALQPQRIDFHQQAARAYRKQGDESMAKSHEIIIDRIRKTQMESDAAAPAVDDASTDTPSTESPATVAPPEEPTELKSTTLDSIKVDDIQTPPPTSGPSQKQTRDQI